jgi:peptidoglycan L-alanyl-D-glutamate endopeptidase CwlK
VSFRLGTVSQSRLIHCDLDLARTIRRGIELTEVDYSVFETLRELERQRELVAAGLSRSLDSHHLPGPDGKANAADLVPFIAGQMRWLRPASIKVAEAMHKAQRYTSAPVTWGGVWDRELSQLDPSDLDGESDRYIERWRKKRPRPTGHKGYWGPLDDPWHFQVPRT